MDSEVTCFPHEKVKEDEGMLREAGEEQEEEEEEEGAPARPLALSTPLPPPPPSSTLTSALTFSSAC